MSARLLTARSLPNSICLPGMPSGKGSVAVRRVVAGSNPAPGANWDVV